MGRKKKNKAESKIFTSFYDFNKWLHEKDWITQNVMHFKANEKMKPLVYGFEVIVPTIK